MLHSPPVGLRYSSSDVDGIGTTKGDPIELKGTPRLLRCSRQVGRAPIQTNDVTVDTILRKQVSVSIQILGVVSSVGPGAVGSGIAEGIDATPGPHALLHPDPGLIQAVVPDFPLARIRLLIEKAQTPRLPAP